MSDIQSNATTTLYINGKPAQDELNRLRNTLQGYKKQLVEVAADSKRGIGSAEWKRLTNEIKSTEKELKSVQSGVASVSQVLLRLDKATPKELKNTLSQLKKELENIERGSKAWNAHVEKIKAVKAELAKLKEETKEHQSLWSRFAKKMFDWGAGLQVVMGAITGITMTARKAVDAYASMDQEMASVRKFTGMTAEQVEDLNEEFKKMDTRTSREGLNRLAQEAGRLGKSSKEDILGFVRAADQINIALDDLGEGATLTLSKLAGLYGIEESFGTEQSLLKVGSVINELSQNCSASAPYLAEFANRMGSIGAEAGVSIQDIMAFGAVLDASAVNVESSATAVGQVLSRMYRDPAKYAKAAGLDVQEFTTLLKQDANQALILFLDTLHQAGGMDVLSPMLADMGENGARVITTLATLAGHIDEVRQQQLVANKAFVEGISVTKEYEVQNNTVQAGLEKAKIRFNEMAVTLGQQLLPLMQYTITTGSVLMKTISYIVDFVIEYRTSLISLAVTIVAYQVAVNAAIIKTKALAAAQAVAKAATYAWTVAQQAWNVILALCSTNVHRLGQEIKILSALLKTNPWGLAIAAIGAMVVAMTVFTKKQKDAMAGEKALMRIREQASEKLVDEKVKIELLVKAAQNENLSLDERNQAITKLNKIIPNYNAHIDATTGKYIAANTALKKYLESLAKQYELEGAKDLLRELGKKEAELNAGIALDKKKEKEYAGSSVDSDAFLDSDASSNVSFNKGRIAARRNSRSKKEAELADVHAQRKAITDTYGEGLQREEIKEPPEPSPDKNFGGNGEGSSHGTSNNTGGKSDKVDKFETEKEWKTQEEAQNRIAYAKGEKNYEEYTKRMDEIAVEFYKKQLEHANLSKNERLSIEADKEEAIKKQTEDANRFAIENEKEAYSALVVIEMQRFADGKVNQATYEETLQQMELAHLRKMTQITVEGTKERKDAEAKYLDALVKDQKKKQKEAEDAERKHQEQLKKIKEDVFGNSAAENKAAYDVALANLTAVFNAELDAAGDNAKEKLRIEKAFQDAKLALAKQYNQEIQGENSNLLERMAESFTDWMDSEGGKAVTQSFDLVVSQMGSIFSGLSSLIQAELEIQTAAIEKRYDKEISRAEGNSYKVAQLEKNKEKEIAKAKNEANRKMFAMQVIQAVAQTAQNALAAYGSALATPIVGPYLAPIAAAMAVAAGAIQIAAIKKQQEASNAQGYAEGGFTPKGGKYEEVGVVHAGEWVASQKLLANPQARAVVNMLDFAQRTNTIGSIRSADVSRSISAPMAIANLQTPASGPAASPQVGSSRAQTDAVITELSAVIYDLKQRLNEPFVTVNTVTGDAGIKKAQDEYEQLMKNKSPKSRR